MTAWASPSPAPVSASVPREGLAPVRRSRLTRRGRLTLVVGLVLLLLAAFSLGRAATTQASTPPPPTPVHTVTVQPGETLWGVATRLAPGRDPRLVVEQLRRLNGLTGASLHAGQQLRLPSAA